MHNAEWANSAPATPGSTYTTLPPRRPRRTPSQSSQRSLRRVSTRDAPPQSIEMQLQRSRSSLRPGFSRTHSVDDGRVPEVPQLPELPELRLSMPLSRDSPSMRTGTPSPSALVSAEMA
jgi:hypothetical protein